MPIPYRLPLRAEQTQELRRLRDHAPHPYVRERAASILAVADGQSLRQAARTAGLKPHRVDTVCAWVHRYQAEGASGLLIRKGRGRKPVSFPAPARQRPHADARVGRPTA
ncbi:MAG TPA: helix-turn-helix domain-containing protein [Ktedonobacterales bacterium]|nr:helix-turn-helix domain-containing protein [Ktedonobacterales bacterium]